MRLQSLALVSILLLALSSAGAQLCTPAMLDTHLRTPSIRTGSPSPISLLAVEFRNRTAEACTLWRPVVSFQPEDRSNPDGLSFPDTDAAQAFRLRHNRLLPGAVAHFDIVLPAISDSISIPRQACHAVDGLTLSPQVSSSALPFFTALHLWLLRCGPGWNSELRDGPYRAEEEIPAQWLARYRVSRRDVAEPASLQQGDLRLWSLDAVQYLPWKTPFPHDHGYSGFIELWLQRSHGDLPLCGVNSLQRREADGETTLVLQHCSEAAPADLASPPPPRLLLPRDFDLKPQRVGPVTYEATIALPGNTLAGASLTLSMRDPNQPMLPAIDSTLPACRTDQLELVETSNLGHHWAKPRNYAPRGQIWWRGRAFTVRNRSQDTCLLGGVPDLSISAPPEDAKAQYSIPLCRDCGNELFTPRGNHWIAMAPQAQAHFIVAAQTVDQTYGHICTVVGGLNLDLDGGPLALPFLAASCSKVYASAWHEGPYRNDALVPLPAAQPISAAPVPAECRSLISPATGQPVFFAQPKTQGTTQGILFGLSAPSHPDTTGVPMMIWLANPSATRKSISSCGPIPPLGTYDILDSNGFRVLDKYDALARSQSKPFHSGPLFPFCTVNVPVIVQPYSCITTRYSLDAYYDLPPGRYRLVPKTAEAGQPGTPLSLPIDVLP